MLHVQRSPQGCRTVDSQEAIKTQRAVSLAGQSGATELQRHRWTPPPPSLAVPPQSMNLGASTEMPGSSCVNEVNLTQNEVNGLRDKELSSFYSVITNHPSAELLTTARVSQGQPGSQGQNYVKYYIYTGLLQVYNYTTVNRCCLKFRV